MSNLCGDSNQDRGYLPFVVNLFHKYLPFGFSSVFALFSLAFVLSFLINLASHFFPLLFPLSFHKYNSWMRFLYNLIYTLPDRSLCGQIILL